jgi:NAD(P)-dependent dehydrogenase (short-subunit alcohol dehydrogenase family)
MDGRLQGKVAIVGGAGSSGPGWGNGKAMAVLFAREGATVVAVDHRLEAAEETRRLIEGEGGPCLVQQADVTNEAEVQAVARAALDAYGRIDVLVNNVGTADPGGPVETSLESWHRVMDINLTSMFLACKHVIPAMEAGGGGSIVNISSIASIRWGGNAYISYAASKAGMNQLAKVIALQHAPRRVRCNVILPGLIATPMAMQSASVVARTSAGADLSKPVPSALVPMGHLGSPWDIAHAALFLASDESRFITGAELVVDGGISATMVARLPEESL